MNEYEMISERKAWLAAVMSMIMPGLGQIYNGELLKGMSFFIIAVLTPVAGLMLSIYLPERFLLAGVFLSLCLLLTAYIISVVDAYKKSRKYGNYYNLKPVNRWYVYVAICLLGAFLVTGAETYVRNNSLNAFKIVTSSMQPEVMKGDLVFVDRTAYKRKPPRKGDIAVFIFPDDKSKVYIGTITGLPGDSVEVEGEERKVPHGSVYLLKNKPGTDDMVIADSRGFGFVPLRDLIGRVRQVYFSLGEEGIRWDRIGVTFDSAS